MERWRKRVSSSSGLSGGEHFPDAAFRVAREERRDVLAHPRSSDLARNAIRVFRQGEPEDQDQVRIVNLCEVSREPAGIDNTLHSLPRCLHRRIRYWIAQMEVVDDDMHKPDPIPCGPYGLWRQSRALAQAMSPKPNQVNHSMRA